MSTFMISTSYEPYIKALCEAINFPIQEAYCTKLELDRYPLPPEEKDYLGKVTEEISRMPMVEWEEGVRGIDDLSPQGQEVVHRLNEVFWDEIARMEIGRVLDEVDPVGGEGKVAALKDILRRTGVEIPEVMYVGDSITDLQALDLVRAGGGLAVSFNGNAYAIQGAQVACLGKDTAVISILAFLFALGGRDMVKTLLTQWGEETLRRAGVQEKLLMHLSDAEVGAITADNQSLWAEKSQRLRRQVRGVKIGSLG